MKSNKGAGKNKRSDKSSDAESVENIDIKKAASIIYDGKTVEKTTQFFEDSLRRVFDSKREFFVHEITEKLESIRSGLTDGVEAGETSKDWQPIESLSRLRSEVGGRFQNIKAKWLEAGFPLREHRGDKMTTKSVNSEGWVALSAWISNQGFETRLTPDKPDCLFEIRRR